MPTSISACGVAQRVRFVEHCHQVSATAALFRDARDHLLGGLSDGLPLVATWPDGCQTPFTIPVTTTRQGSGGIRHWFRCPLGCGRRVGCLYAPSQAAAFRCRTCWGLQYASQYRRRSGTGRTGVGRRLRAPRRLSVCTVSGRRVPVPDLLGPAVRLAVSTAVGDRADRSGSDRESGALDHASAGGSGTTALRPSSPWRGQCGGGGTQLSLPPG